MKPAVIIASILSLAALIGIGALLAQPEIPAEPDAEDPPRPDVRLVNVPSLGVAVPCRVLSVHDGDTLKVEIKLVADIRMLDCWAPELSGKDRLKGFAARDHLKKLAEGKTGVVHIPLTSENIGKATSMSRVLGKVYINGDDLSYLQVKAKHATKDKPE